MLESVSMPPEILGASDAAKDLRDFVEIASQDTAPVLLRGEPGSGKQALARRIHEASCRRAGPLLLIDCSLYYERELKRELYGYGGSGAEGRERRGILEFADVGSCYLSHVEELSPALQRGLIEFVKSGRFRRLGDGKEVASKARLIVSTDKNLSGFVRSGLIDEDFRLAISAHEASLPPLRERVEDIPAIVDAFVAARCVQGKHSTAIAFSADACHALQCYTWPGNFSELAAEIDRVIERGVQDVRPEHLALEIGTAWLGQTSDPQTRSVLEELDSCMREFRILSRIGCEFGDATVEGEALGSDLIQPIRDLYEEFS